ncbi:hypothetical protein BJ123_10974 [Rhodopseudomonas thermotolerans]|uniref:Uncharacterized protein n=2 Tax=Rhodopseudomonas TaxID=1073 RepID=A0A336JMN0_9BRAD|nr:hypothetical protein BJ125_10974 [Rhodopseudomonas pentothenatexigens]REG03073.1 hypothetical protein BJ123_10974 [Rhodopseudomonas thermotolerans]SSW90920.1 hypothetical protein SAMN05892882_10974 [Rhodopseudomonas pentothenatexigens]
MTFAQVRTRTRDVGSKWLEVSAASPLSLVLNRFAPGSAVAVRGVLS